MDARSEKNLQGVHPDLAALIRRAWLGMQAREDRLSFIVIEGMRTKARQAQLVAAGASQTMNGRHMTGHAVDLMATVAGVGRWDWPLYAKLGAEVKACALDAEIPIVWGGDWKTLRDGPHFELSRKDYPA
jgi:peptidoglycan L-alanyl-D-glutamate endopeptidase CwlK